MSWTDTIAETRNNLRELGKTIPEATKGFAGLSKAVKENGALSFKEKEYVALGIAVATHCMPCIAFHVEALVKAGATRDEVADVLAMCIQMAGGPGLMVSAEALAIYDELSAA
ncbi:MAG: gamma-carboxymuconolactone decarboxylase subunit-like protein [Rhodobacteraceae bacterium HLUCCO07]|nr:MAG: gamma-carboxymuconolactone decarboxylase subunit-like protein [Rhodobacteraceae bacterium HLUCCO07]